MPAIPSSRLGLVVQGDYWKMVGVRASSSAPGLGLAALEAHTIEQSLPDMMIFSTYTFGINKMQNVNFYTQIQLWKFPSEVITVD